MSALPVATPAMPPNLPPQPRPRRLKADGLLKVIVAFTWLAIWRVQDLIPILGKLRIVIFVEIALVVWFISDATPTRRLKWLKSPIVYAIAAIIGLMVTSLPTSLWPGKGVNFMIFDFMPTVTMMVVLATSLREQEDLEWIAFAHLVGGAVFAAYIFKYGHMGSDGRLGNLVFYDANDFALVMVCSIPFAIYFMRPGVSAKKRFFALCAMALFTIMVIRSGSRGGFLGLILVSLYILLQFRSIPARLRIGAIVAGVLVFSVFASATYWKMMGTMLNMKEDYNMKEQTGRKAVWNRGLLYIKMRPLFGVGIRAFPQAEGKLSPIAIEYAERGKGIKWSVAHNSYIEIGAECGALALVIFPALLYMTFKTLLPIRVRRPPDELIKPNDQAFSQMLIASMIGFSACGFFLSAEYFPYLYFLLGLTLGQQAILKRRFERLRKLPTAPSASAVAVASLAGRPMPQLPPPAPSPWAPAGT